MFSVLKPDERTHARRSRRNCRLPVIGFSPNNVYCVCVFLVCPIDQQGIMRCKRCRTYINPFVGWLGNGRQWRCNVCGMVNDVPTSYFCHLDQNGNRTDKAQRPELSQASVELVRERRWRKR